MQINNMFEKIGDKIESLKKEAIKGNKKTAIVFTVTTKYFPDKLKILPNRNTKNFICLQLRLNDDKIVKKLGKYVDGKVDVIFVDAENKSKNCKDVFKKFIAVVKTSKVYAIKGNDFSADSAFGIIATVLGPLTSKKICVIGAGNIGSKLALKLLECGANVYIINSTKKSSLKVVKAINTIKPRECPNKVLATTRNALPSKLDCVIGFTRGIPVIDDYIVLKVKKNGIILDGGSGTISYEGIKEARKKKLKVFKLDIRMGFNSYVDLMLGSEKLISKISGSRKMNRFNIVAGGFIGNEGDIVVDSITEPTKILGVLDGKGDFYSDYSAHKENIYQLNEYIKKRFEKL